jgi:hypothetical protein
MSDFLFRMVERAAGLATATTPQPPRTFQWMAPAATLPSHFPAASAWETQAPPLPSAKFNPATLDDARNRRSVDVQSSLQPSVPETSSFLLANAGDISQPLIPPSPGRQSTPRRDVKAEATKEAAPRFQNHLPENTEQTGHKINVSHLPPEAAAKRQPLAKHPDRPIIADHEAAHFPLEEPARKTSIHTAQPATPLPRESKPHAGDVRMPKPSSEPPVEVKIGRVEIHFDAPPTPVASAAPVRPGGFSEYAELRRYASRKR